MRTVKVTLNGQTVQIEELRRRDNQAWREKLEGEFKELAGALEGAGDIEITSGNALGGLVRAVAGKVMGSVDIIAGLLEAYAPQIKPLMAEAYDSEVLEAFTAVLGLAYPFGQMLDRLKAMAGSRQPPMPQS